MFFWKTNFLWAILMGIFFSVSDMGRKKYSENTLCLIKTLVLQKKNYVATTCCEKKIFWAQPIFFILTPEKNHSPPPPLKLNGWSLIIIYLPFVKSCIQI